MGRYIRAAAAGATYFFTLALQDRQSRWLVDHAACLRSCVMAVQARHPFRTMPPDDADFPVRWMSIKQKFTKRLGASGSLDAQASALRGGKGERSLWQRRYWEHQVRDDDDFARHVDYIHFNPVRHGLVQRAADWPHSSFHRYVRQGRLPADWGVAEEVVGPFGE